MNCGRYSRIARFFEKYLNISTSLRQLDTQYGGTQLENGTWTDAMQYFHRNVILIWQLKQTDPALIYRQLIYHWMTLIVILFASNYSITLFCKSQKCWLYSTNHTTNMRRIWPTYFTFFPNLSGCQLSYSILVCAWSTVSRKLGISKLIFGFITLVSFLIKELIWKDITITCYF